MLKYHPFQLQLDQISRNLEANIQRFHSSLKELRRLSLLLYEETKAGGKDIQDWFLKEGFAVDEDGFWQSIPLRNAYREGCAPKDSISYSWPPDLVNNQEACFRMYCLRNLGPILREIHAEHPSALWIYYQDTTNTAMQFPFIDQVSAIAPDFDWHTYHTYTSVEPEKNPEREIRWTNPTIDYAGMGLILSVSIPVYSSDKFLGLWSIDVPLHSLYPEGVFDTILEGQTNFIINREGDLEAHPSIETRIDVEKGSIFREHFHNLGSGYESLDPEKMIEEESGHFSFLSNGEEIMGSFSLIPGIQWIFITTFPRQSMEKVLDIRIREALDHVRVGDFSFRIEGASDLEQTSLIADGFNEMAAALEDQEFIREQNRKEKDELEIKLQQFQKIEALGTLAGGIAHDFNNILYPIMGYAELLIQKLTDAAPEREMAGQILNAAVRAKELTGQILTFSRQAEDNNRPVAVHPVIEEVLKLLRSSIPKSIEIRTDIQAECPSVLADQSKLHQIVMNLCTNAYHAVQEKKGFIKVSLNKLWISDENRLLSEHLPSGEYVRILVSDNGCGMDRETRSRVFDPYFTTKEAGKGTGLGLSIVYGIVRKINGDIRIDSAVGEGTSVHVFLPVAGNEV